MRMPPSDSSRTADLPIDEEGKHIFLRGADGQLYERLDGRLRRTDGWEDRTRAGDPALRESPAVHVDSRPPHDGPPHPVGERQKLARHVGVRDSQKRRGSRRADASPCGSTDTASMPTMSTSTGHFSITAGPGHLARTGGAAYDGARLAKLATFARRAAERDIRPVRSTVDIVGSARNETRTTSYALHDPTADSPRVPICCSCASMATSPTSDVYCPLTGVVRLARPLRRRLGDLLAVPDVINVTNAYRCRWKTDRPCRNCPGSTGTAAAGCRCR